MRRSKGAKRSSKPTKKAPAKSPPRPARAAKRRVASPAARVPGGKRSKPTWSPDAATRMTAYSKKVLQEEAKPVAVRSWSEAKQGHAGGQEYVPRTGEVRPAAVPPRPPQGSPEAEGESEHGDRVRIEPLSGPVAVPRSRVEEFDLAPARPTKGKRSKAETPKDFGPVELRQATASGGRHLTRAKAENLQRGAGRIQPLASAPTASAAKRASGRGERPRRDASPEAAGRLPDLSDWGEIEIDQQTLSGSRKVGNLDAEEAERAKRKGPRPS